MERGKFRNKLEDADEVKITFIGRITGKRISTPLWFVMEGDSLFLLPVMGSKSNWFRNVVKHPEIVLSVGRVSSTFVAKPVRDKKRVDGVVRRFRSKYGAGEIKKWYSGFDACVEVPL